MKVCPDCQSANADTSISCTSCGRYLSEAETKAAAEALESEHANEDRLDKKRKRRKIVLIALAVCVGVSMNVYAIWNATIGRISVFVIIFLLFIELIGFLLLLLPEDNRLWSYFFWGAAGWALQNPENAKPNDDFFYRYKFLGAILAIYGIVILVFLSVR